MQQVNRQLLFAVCERAQIAKVAALLSALRAELGLVLFGVVEGFHAVVCLGAAGALGTLVGLRETTHLRRICAKQAPLVLLVVVEALLLIVTAFAGARFRLEGPQVEQEDA